MSEQTTENVPQGGSGSKVLGAIVLIIALAAIAYYFVTVKPGVVQPASAEAVATVNGQDVTRTQYDARYAQIVATVTAQGQSATTTAAETAIKNQAIDDLVTEALVMQAATKEGIKADDTAVNTQITQAKANFADTATYEKALSAQGFTDATFKDAVSRTNIIQQYLKAHVNVSSATASAAEIKALYDQAVKNDKTIPPLAQVKTQVENQIVQQKQQQLVTAFIQTLKASSTVNILLK